MGEIESTAVFDAFRVSAAASRPVGVGVALSTLCFLMRNHLGAGILQEFFSFRMASPASSNISRSMLAARMKRLRIEESDLEEVFSRSSGPGGQHVNKVSTSVTLTHRPTGTSVTVQDSRSQTTNRHLARVRLIEEFERRKAEELQSQRAAAAKRRRQRATRSRATKRKMVEQKRHRSEIKKYRGRVD